jgi:hypothetical protein
VVLSETAIGRFRAPVPVRAQRSPGLDVSWSSAVASGILGDMSADRSLQHDDVSEPEVLDLDTGDAFLRWAETAAEPEGIELRSWLTLEPLDRSRRGGHLCHARRARPLGRHRHTSLASSGVAPCDALPGLSIAERCRDSMVRSDPPLRSRRGLGSASSCPVGLASERRSSKAGEERIHLGLEGIGGHDP